MSDMKNYKCLNCGNSVQFDPPSGKWKCDFCSSTFSEEEIEAAAISTQAQQKQVYSEFGSEQAAADMDLQEYHCNNCGSEIVAQDSEAATFCIYCKSPIVLVGKFKGELNPHRIIPFTITEAQAKDLYREWIKKKFFAPSSFKNETRIKEIRGIYAPFWMFGGDVNGYIQGEGVKKRYWSDSDYDYVESSYYDVERGGDVCYDNVPIDSSTKMDDALMEAVEPFDYEGFKSFNPAYLSGFLAEILDVSKEESQKVATQRMEGFMEARLEAEISGYDSFSADTSHFNVTNMLCENVMMPVYYLANPYKDEMKAFMINGQTGKVYGNTPYDVAKIIFTGVGIFVVVWILSALIGGFFA